MSERDNGNDHRAAAKVMQAEKAARPAAPCASYCYPALNRCGGGFPWRCEFPLHSISRILVLRPAKVQVFLERHRIASASSRAHIARDYL